MPEDGERGLTSSLPHLPRVGGGSKAVKQGHPHLVMAPALALPGAVSSSLAVLAVSVVQRGGGHFGELPCWVEWMGLEHGDRPSWS